MLIQLRNIGMIREADVRIDGLTVIAGENDTGKSTVGKALYLILSSQQDDRGSLSGEKHSFIAKYSKIIELIFHDNITDGNGKITFLDGKNRITAEFPDNFQTPVISNIKSGKYEVMMIETPLVWNFFKFFNALEKIRTEASFFNENYQIPYPYLMWDLYKRLSLVKYEKQPVSQKKHFLKEIDNIMGGKFIKDDFGDFVFIKQNKKIPVVNVATGIKQFGILQKLLENNYLEKNSVVIFDEPEVHLHPKWQLKMAEIIVALVKNGVKIVVNSHSPYMIEALQRYSTREEVIADFYLAEDGYIRKVNDSNEETLSEIFRKLSDPFEVFEEMEMTRLLNG